MALYFFDTRDNEVFIEDDVGVELPDLEAVKEQAALSLAELARDVLPGSMKRTLTVEVRDERQAVMMAKLLFEAIILVPSGQ
jgi:SHS2 domain-containing protein